MHVSECEFPGVNLGPSKLQGYLEIPAPEASFRIMHTTKAQEEAFHSRQSALLGVVHSGISGYLCIFRLLKLQRWGVDKGAAQTVHKQVKLCSYMNTLALLGPGSEVAGLCCAVLGARGAGQLARHPKRDAGCPARHLKQGARQPGARLIRSARQPGAGRAWVGQPACRLRQSRTAASLSPLSVGVGLAGTLRGTIAPGSCPPAG